MERTAVLRSVSTAGAADHTPGLAVVPQAGLDIFALAHICHGICTSLPLRRPLCIGYWSPPWPTTTAHLQTPIPQSQPNNPSHLVSCGCSGTHLPAVPHHRKEGRGQGLGQQLAPPGAVRGAEVRRPGAEGAGVGVASAARVRRPRPAALALDALGVGCRGPGRCARAEQVWQAYVTHSWAAPAHHAAAGL